MQNVIPTLSLSSTIVPSICCTIHAHTVEHGTGGSWSATVVQDPGTGLSSRNAWLLTLLQHELSHLTQVFDFQCFEKCRSCDGDARQFRRHESPKRLMSITAAGMTTRGLPVLFESVLKNCLSVFLTMNTGFGGTDVGLEIVRRTLPGGILK